MGTEYERIAQSIGPGRSLLRGAAGTGKTMAICARARLLRERHPAWRILVLCFNTSLASLLQRALPADPRTEVATFHDWAQAQLEASGVVVPPPPGRGTQWDGYWTQDMARLLLTAFREQRIAAGAYQAILIDEGQDFVGDWYRALVQALDPATGELLVALDPAQNIYGREVAWGEPGPRDRRADTDPRGQSPEQPADRGRGMPADSAAIQANLLAGNRVAGDDWLLLDVIPLSLGLETMGGLVEKIIERNSTIPVARAQEFTTFKDGQTAIAIHVVQGERELVSDCRSLARFELRGIPPMPAGAARVRVTFQVDADGLLDVNALEIGSGIQASIVVKPSYGLGDDDIARMLQESFGSADDDMRRRALREQQVDAQRLIEATKTALASDGDLLDSDERTTIEELLSALSDRTRGDDHTAIKSSIDALARATDDFAARRMDRSIRAALAGRRIDDLAGVGRGAE